MNIRTANKRQRRRDIINRGHIYVKLNKLGAQYGYYTMYRRGHGWLKSHVRFSFGYYRENGE